MAGKNSLLSDGAWLTGLQGAAAIGQLAGVRLLTEVLPPEIFGVFNLWLGIVLLVATGIANPTMQAMLRYYPEYALKGCPSIVVAVVLQQLIRLTKWILPSIMIGVIVAITYNWADSLTLGLLFGLVAVEIARMQYTALLSCERKHRLSGIWFVAEAWGRPVLAWAMVSTLGTSIQIILIAYLLASMCVLVVVMRFIVLEESTVFSANEKSDLVRRFWIYSIPLLPLGIVGWVSGMGDRYMIGLLLSPADVGLYVAMYGLASRPMLMFGAIIESIIRPVYLNALNEGDSSKAKGYLRNWTLLVVIGSCLAIMAAVIGHQLIANILLGAEYRSVSFLLPWIVGGHALLILSYVANRVCYAHGATKSIFIIEVTGAVAAITVGFISIKLGGLEGAAIATTIYFGMQLFIAFKLARKWLSFN